MTSDTCSITCTARSAAKELSRKGYGKWSRSHKTSAFVRLLRSIPIAPGNLLIPQPTSRVRAVMWRTHSCVPRSHSCERLEGRSSLSSFMFAGLPTRHARVRALHQPEAFLQCIHSEVGLIARDDERRAQPDRVATRAQHQQTSLECQC